MGEWGEVPIGELCEIFDGPHATPKKTASGPIFLGIANLDRGRLDLTTTEHLSEDDYLRWTRRVEPRPGDVVFSYETRLGEAAIIPEGIRCCLGRRMGLLRARPSKVDSRFLLYAYLGPAFQETLRARTVHGSTVDRILLSDMPQFPIKIPTSIAEQRAIANLLGSLDGKIDLNRRLSETLDAIARALFKSWFVDFDPVRAKMEGRWMPGRTLGGLPGHLHEFFPSRLAPSGVGEIPVGWQIGSLHDVVDHLRDNLDPRKAPNVTFLHFSIPAFDEGQWPRTELGQNIKSVKSMVRPGTILVSKLNPEVDRVWLVDLGPEDSDRAVCSTEFLVLQPRTPFGRAFAYCLARSSVFRHGVKALVTGTSGSHQRARAHDILALPVIVPPKKIVESFDEMAGPLLERGLIARRESRNLAALRDTLLPMLISGELRVKDAGRFLEERAL